MTRRNSLITATKQALDECKKERQLNETRVREIIIEEKGILAAWNNPEIKPSFLSQLAPLSREKAELEKKIAMQTSQINISERLLHPESKWPTPK